MLFKVKIIWARIEQDIRSQIDISFENTLYISDDVWYLETLYIKMFLQLNLLQASSSDDFS